MTKLTNVTKDNKKVITMMKQVSPFKKVEAYEYKDGNYFYCITNHGKLHVSGSTPLGPVCEEDLIYVFNKLTKKLIYNFEFMKTARVLYLIERENPIN